MYLLVKQQQVARDNLDRKVFLEGLAGTGKTTAGIERVKQLLHAGAPPTRVLVLVPQRATGLPWQEALRRSRAPGGAEVRVTTLGSLARELLELFWPLIAADTGCARPLAPPRFPGLELSQYLMRRFVGDEIERRDYFRGVTISRNRLYTQIVDNLNKSALVGFPPEEIGARLKAAWRGSSEQAFIYDDAQACASLFRAACLKHNLIDFSLLIDILRKQLWPLENARGYLIRRYRHVLVDNLEEDTPTLHDLLGDWLPHCDSALLIYDSEAGLRRFLGADPAQARSLQALCDLSVTLDRRRAMSEDVAALHFAMAKTLGRAEGPLPKHGNGRAALRWPARARWHPQMIDWTVQHIARLVHKEGVAAQEIVVVAPFMPDALRFALQARLDERGVPHRSHRPSRALRDEPEVRALLTFARLAQHAPGLAPDRFDVASALTTAIEAMDPIRARLLADALYRDGGLLPFENITDARLQQRITFQLGERYDRLCGWLAQVPPELPLDLFFSSFFGEVMSQPGFGLHRRESSGATVANLVDSARSFRRLLTELGPAASVNQDYLRMVEEGVLANQYLRDWELDRSEGVLLAPAHTYLMSNRPVDYQFWLNVGSSGWGRRVYQPLTHPWVLSRHWEAGRKWLDADEEAAGAESLANVALGLLRRCRKRVYLGISEYGERGMEERGPLLLALHNMQRYLMPEGDGV
ncbi:MAG: hypothetical protein OXP68_06970 [Anaerolineaceae bacterium]|nr:hypothetical protein [Anaerolineaceae bacterium]MDE0328501.1 hypothetical protein [Anaerolineaceae bacterium]